MKTRNSTKILGVILSVILVGSLAYGGWVVSRWLNYSLGYESMVKNTVCEMVKSENLKQPCDS